MKKKKYLPSDFTWALEDSLVPEHKHGETDDSKNILRDTETGDAVSIDKGNEIANERLGSFFDCEFDRRNLLKAGGLGAGVMLATSAAPSYAYSSTAKADAPILVNIFLRGAADGLTILNPYNDPYYHEVRKGTKINLATSNIISGTYALAPEMKPLMDAWNAGELAFANAVGNKAGQTRSHFLEQGNRDRAAPVQIRSGWLGRYLSLSTGDQPMFRAFSHNHTVVPSLYMDNDSTLAISDFDKFYIPGDNAGMRKLLNSTYQYGGGDLAAHASETLQAVNEVQAMVKAGYTPANGAAYSGKFGDRMKEIAQVIKANKGVEVVSVDLDGWDTHRRQVEVLHPMIDTLAKNLAAFRKDLGADLMKRVIVVTQSEFGRTTVENSGGGTDHGMGTFVMVMSGKASQKSVVGDFPGLKPTSGERDMRVTTDYRDIMSEILTRGMGATQISQIFPGYTPTKKGILRLDGSFSGGAGTNFPPPPTGIGGSTSGIKYPPPPTGVGGGVAPVKRPK